MKILETKKLVTNFYTYEGVVKALNGISLKINYGSTFGLVGESGCGKSVTVRSLMRIIQSPGKIEKGDIYFFPNSKKKKEVVDILKLSSLEMQAIRGNDISMIFQEPNVALNPLMTIGEQIGESYIFHSYGMLEKSVLKKHKRIAKLKNIPVLKKIWTKLIERQAEKLSIKMLGKLGIPNPQGVVKLYPHSMSGGMRQRIVIAIALACSPFLLIADEATSNLDVTIQAQILDLLKDLKKKKIISTILLITHDLGVVAQTCDRVGVMYAGDMCEVADAGAIFRKAAHPYTKALLNSVPKFNQRKKLQSIEGTVPNLVHPPSGCRFHPRCPLCKDICKIKKPSLKEISKGHLVACHCFENKVTK